jgi:glycosyltransferase involved in cell wall biosynthesis
MDTTITIATPCYNEADSLPAYFERISDVTDELTRSGWVVSLLLIDDGSRDSTPQLLDDYARKHTATRVVRHPQNLGYGGAIKTGLALAETAWVVFIDSDSNYDQRLILELVKKVGPDVDIVNVSMLAPGGAFAYPSYRFWLSAGCSRLYRVLFPRLTKGIYTMTCGFRLYRRTLVPHLFPRADDFVATAEIMLRALRQRARVLEFPATNTLRVHGVSKMKILRVMRGHLGLMLRARLGLLPPPLEIDAHLRRIGVPSTANR